jgi:hypothetical protein
MEELKDYGGPRFVNDTFYFGICKEQIDRYETADARKNELEEQIQSVEYDSPEYWEIEKELSAVSEEWWRSGTIVIVFAAMCLEALIYDYGARNTSDNYFNRYLDRLSPVAKWIVVPQIIIGDSIDRDGQAFELLQKLFRNRNNLVHSQSKHVPLADKEELAERIEDNKSDFEEAVVDAVRAVFKVTSEMRSMHPESINFGWYDPSEHGNEPYQKYT